MTHRQKMLVRAFEVWQESHDKKIVLLVTRFEGCTASQCRYVERRVKVWEASSPVRNPEDHCSHRGRGVSGGQSLGRIYGHTSLGLTPFNCLASFSCRPTRESVSDRPRVLSWTLVRPSP